MFSKTQFVLVVLFFVDHVQNEDIRLPSFIMFNQSLSTISPLYLCHLHQLNNVKEKFLQGYEIMNGGATGHVHHLLVFECSTREVIRYSGLCGKENVKAMPKLVYEHCQTRILIAWANGGERKYAYPNKIGLKFDRFTQLLIEVHFDPTLPNHDHSIGIQLDFYEENHRPDHEIGILTVGTLAQSPIYLPPRLEIIDFPTFCSRDCLNAFVDNRSTLNVFALLFHAHRRAVRLTMKINETNVFFDRNPFEFHRQTLNLFSSPFPQIHSNDEISLICSYSTQNEQNRVVRGGFHSDDEMCQAFIFYYPRISSFPLCLSMPIYSNFSSTTIWTDALSQKVKKQLESTRDHWIICGDKTNENQTNLRVKILRKSHNENRYSFPQIFVVFLFVFVLILFIKRKFSRF